MEQLKTSICAFTEQYDNLFKQTHFITGNVGVSRGSLPYKTRQNTLEACIMLQCYTIHSSPAHTLLS